jgi:4-aminobutyrate aminotransferase-like enzyme
MAASRNVGPSSYFDPAHLVDLDAATADLVRRRLDALGPAYRLFYETPLHIVRGSGVHLYDADGHEYLDFYNNVASLGHSHPRVTAAIAEQAGILNTHTRYLHEGVVSYAEQLLETFPHQLRHVMFTCTGSEAGDLALRIAKHCTGGTGVIVTRNAYHGVTTETAAISPSLGGLDSVAPWVRTVQAPDPFRTDMEGFADLGEWFAAQVQDAIDDLTAHGVRFAALVVDSILSSDGVFPDPVGVLARARSVVADAGGLYLADEVQSGFARTGEAMWGFQRHGTTAAPLVPDLVTVGKPMGNGMPVAGVILRPEVVESFARDQRYFNTFGGNALSIAAAQAVLDVIIDEQLQDSVVRVGTRMRDDLRSLAVDHRGIGDVRGAGMFLGVELVDDDGAPDQALTLRVVNDLRQRRVLVATCGPDNNVLKVRPPLIATMADADRFVATLDATLSDVRR